jgi:SAM-dependent methyltransferase
MSKPSYEPAHCVVCGNADSVLLADAESMRAEVETLWAFHERRLRPETPTRRLLDRVAFSERAPLQLVRCTGCGLVYRNPVERARELAEIYERDEPAPDVLRALHETQLSAVRAQARRLRGTLGRGGSGLEVGSYVGAFLRAARDEGLSFEGLDVNPTANAFARTLGYTVHDGALPTFDAHRRFDVVAIWNTFDQLAEPRAALAIVRTLLNPGGVLALRVPNGAFYAEQRDRLTHGSAVARWTARALLAHNNLLGFPYRAGFSPASLGRLLDEIGFAVASTFGDVLVPVADEWTRRWARIEERLLKRLIRMSAARDPARAPWFEIYARPR